MNKRRHIFLLCFSTPLYCFQIKWWWWGYKTRCSKAWLFGLLTNLLNWTQDLLRETQDRRVQLEDMLRRAEEQQQQVKQHCLKSKSKQQSKLHRGFAISSNCKRVLLNWPQLDAQLADMDSHREKALAAVAKGNNVLQDAANTLKTLKGNYWFNNNGLIIIDLVNFMGLRNSHFYSPFCSSHTHHCARAVYFLAKQEPFLYCLF